MSICCKDFKVRIIFFLGLLLGLFNFFSIPLLCNEEPVEGNLKTQSWVFGGDVVKSCENPLVNELGLSKQDCSKIISFLKNEKANDSVWKTVKENLQTTFRDGLYLYGAILTGLGTLYYFSKDQEKQHVDVTSAIASGLSMITFYVLVKVIESMCLNNKSEDDIINEMISRARDIEDVAE